ncbi:MAG TPA: hypothetical protein VFB50_19510 [Chloroflexota bacterium]|nr:hypothetical protein [Chloroflexota bacterium]
MSDSPSPETGAPAPTGPDAGPQVDIALGPDQSIYPESLRPAEPAAPPAEVPEPAETTVVEATPDVAGSAPSPDQGDGRGSRRQRGDDAYQRGLTEGRAALEREQAQRQQQDAFQQTQREANQRIEQLFNELASPDYATQDRARQAVLQLYSGNRQAAALMQTTRQQILQEMAADFANLGQLDGLDQDGYQSLHSAPSAAELAKRAFDLGRKSRDDHVAKLEGELEGLRGRLVGSRATPERTNGSGAPNLSGTIGLEEYLAMSPKDAAKLPSATIDALTAQMASDAANGRNGPA